MDEITPEQKKQLGAWAIQRDAILGEISKLKIEEEALTERNINLSNSNTDIETRINQSTGRLAELDRQEEIRKNFISIELADLEKRKAALENQIPGFEKEVSGLSSRIALMVETLTTITDVHGKVFDRATAIDQIIEHVTRVSSQNITDIETFMGLLKTSIQEIIDKNTKNVATTNIVLEKLPRYIFELQKPIPIRRPIIGPVSNDPIVDRTLKINPEIKK
jgi:predicted  nucleic acid-binding Zn-ribbon protein